MSRASMPMPVSATVKTSSTRRRVAGLAAAVKTTVPSWVNFTALSARFSKTARSRNASPKTSAGRSLAMAISVLTPLLPARATSASATAAARLRGANGSRCKVSPAASAFTASTMSVVRAVR